MIHNSFGNRHPAIWAGVNLQLWNRLVSEEDFAFRMNAATTHKKKNQIINPLCIAGFQVLLFCFLTIYNCFDYMQLGCKNEVKAMKENPA